MFRFATTLSLALTAALLTGACTKGPKTGDDSNTNQANRAAQTAATVPLLQPTLKGDIERISLFISTAREDARNNKWQEAAAQLQGANKEVETALGRKLRLREEFEALRAAIDRTIGAVERRDKEADSQLAELQVRIGAIKVNTP
jgi:hypothetical protein